MADHVFVVPGFLGSTLQQQNTKFPNRNIWYSPVEFAAYGADNLDLAADGLQPGPLAGNPCIATSVVDLGVYEPMISCLANDGMKVHVFDYDWRKFLRLNGATLANFIAEKSAGENFWVVAHSMGGLLARVAFADFLAGGGDVTKWQRTLYAGTPHGGSYAAAAFLAGAPVSVSGFNIFWLALGNLVPGRGLNSITRSRQDRSNQVLASWPALYALLPGNVPPWDGSDPLVPELFKQGTYAGQNRYVTQARLDQGQSDIAFLHGLNAGTRPSEVCVAGYGFSTPTKLRAVTALSEDADYDFDLEGDGTVSQERALLPGVLTKNYPVDHQGLMRSSLICADIHNLLRDGLVASVTVPPPVETTPLLRQPDPPPLMRTIPFPQLVRKGDP